MLHFAQTSRKCTLSKQFAQKAILSQNYNYYEESKHLSSKLYSRLQRLYLGGTQSPNKIGPGPAAGHCSRKLGNLRPSLRFDRGEQWASLRKNLAGSFRAIRPGFSR